MNYQKNVMLTLIWLLIFSSAMGIFECSVVVYLRRLYYPDGFGFPMQTMEAKVALVELFREAASILMLVSVAFLASQKAAQRLGAFLIAFAVWDITYYLFLKIFLDWPPSFFTWDILFLIPVTWTGPVLAPLINSLTMILLGTALFHFGSFNINALPGKYSWILLITGTVITLFVYMQDFTAYILSKFSLGDWFELPTPDNILQHAMAYVPVSFNWPLFMVGEFLFLVAIFLYLRRMLKQIRPVIL